MVSLWVLNQSCYQMTPDATHQYVNKTIGDTLDASQMTPDSIHQYVNKIR